MLDSIFQEFDPGSLIHQITWQRKTVSGQNASGEDNYAWTDVLTCRASIESSKALIAKNPEFQSVMQRWAESDFLLTQWYSTGLSEDMRISRYIDGVVVYLDVLGIDDPSGEGRYQVVACRTFEGDFTA